MTSRRLEIRRSVFVAANASSSTAPKRGRRAQLKEENGHGRRSEMGKIIVSDNVSLDGVIQDPAGDEGFRVGGWVGLIRDRPRLNKLALDEALGTEALLLGRRSYEWFAARWPSRSGELADRLNSLPKYVVSSTLEHADWNNSTVLEGDVRQRGHEAEARARRGHRRPRQLPARPHADGARPRRRAAAEDLPGRARGRQAPLRRTSDRKRCASSTPGPSRAGSSSSPIASRPRRRPVSPRDRRRARSSRGSPWQR